METTFITIQDLTPDAHILYSSDSIVDILGYSPEDVVERSCWDFFHPDELPYARAKHGRGIELDRAAVLSYCRLKGKDGRWHGCEVVFTVVFDVLVGCTSIYRRGVRSQSRALEAPTVRRLFSHSPRDPRYHMLSHLSSRFDAPPLSPPRYPPRQPSPLDWDSPSPLHEPRAALFVNRYTRTLTIMYATEGLADVLGISGAEMVGRSFYYCVQENCLRDAVRCLENAKANDSIAYLRFWYRDPRTDDAAAAAAAASPIGARHDPAAADDTDSVMTDVETATDDSMDEEEDAPSVQGGQDARHAAADSPPRRDGRSGSRGQGQRQDQDHGRVRLPSMPRDVELEAVVSCASDGLVVCLRQAAPILPPLLGHGPGQALTHPQGYRNGLFAAPWSHEPILPTPHQRSSYARGAALPPVRHAPLAAPQPVHPAPHDYMNSIRDIAVFAWALTGINGTLADWGRGTPRGEAQPPNGLPIWQPPSLNTSGSSGGGSGNGHSSSDAGQSSVTRTGSANASSNPSSMSRSPVTDYSSGPGAQDATGAGGSAGGRGSASDSSNTSVESVRKRAKVQRDDDGWTAPRGDAPDGVSGAALGDARPTQTGSDAPHASTHAPPPDEVRTLDGAGGVPGLACTSDQPERQDGADRSEDHSEHQQQGPETWQQQPS